MDTLYSEEENEDEEMTKAEKNKKRSMNMNHSGALPPIGTVANIAGAMDRDKNAIITSGIPQSPPIIRDPKRSRNEEKVGDKSQTNTKI
jgi:hypothetical protein